MQKTLGEVGSWRNWKGELFKQSLSPHEKRYEVEEKETDR